MYLSNKDWLRLMDLASACMYRQLTKFRRLQDKLVKWRLKYGGSKCFFTPPDTHAIDFDALWDELTF